MFINKSVAKQRVKHLEKKLCTNFRDRETEEKVRFPTTNLEITENEVVCVVSGFRPRRLRMVVSINC